MSYNRIDWKDRVVQRPMTYFDTANGDGSKTYHAAPGTVYQEGTPISGTNMNAMDEALQHINIALDEYMMTMQAELRAANARIAELEEIGDTTSKNPNAKTAANETLTNLDSVALDPGVYIVEGVASFDSNGTGYRQLGFGNNASSNNRDRFAISRVGAATGTTTDVQVTMLIKVTSTTTIYLNAYQNSGSSLSVTGGIRYTRIR